MGISEIKTLENWLWEAACKIRGEVDAAKYKDFILPLIFIKRLSDVFEDELTTQAEQYGSAELAEQLIDDDHSLVRVYLPEAARWANLVKLTTGIGQALTDAVRSIARHNNALSGVIDVVDFNATTAGQRIISDEQLKALMQVLNKYRLGLKDVEPDILGRAYEYLLRKFAEGSGQSAGEFYTPKEVGMLIAHILAPEPGMSCYDPCAGSSGLLIKCGLRFTEIHGTDSRLQPLHLYGQEIQPATYALSRMNLFLHDLTEGQIKLGDSIRRPAFVNEEGSLSLTQMHNLIQGGKEVPHISRKTYLKQFDLVTANPMWNQNFEQAVYDADPYGRFAYGAPPNNTADWGWVQHMHASLADGGRMAVVLDTGAVSRGSGNAGKARERDIRKAFVDADLVEAVLLLPENLFYNTTAPGIILIINKAKKHPGEVLLINAANAFEKGRPKNFLTETHIDGLAALYHDWREEAAQSRIITNADLVQQDYNLSPSRYIQQGAMAEVLSLEDAVVALRSAEDDCAEADRKLNSLLQMLGA